MRALLVSYLHQMKTIFITGAGGGIGLATAQLLSDKGYDVIVSVRNKEKAVALLPSSVEITEFDVRDYKKVKEVFDDVIVRHAKIDVLINNAGLGYFDPIADGSIEHWPDGFFDQTNKDFNRLFGI